MNGIEGMVAMKIIIAIQSALFHLEIKLSFLGSFSVDYLAVIHLHLSNELILRPENALRDKNLAPGTHLKKIQSVTRQKIMQHHAQSQICR